MMMMFRLLNRFLWDQDEQRLRAFWRVCLHTLLVLLLTGIPLVLWTLGTVVFGAHSGANTVGLFSVSNLTQQVGSPGLLLLSIANFFGILGSTLIAGCWIDRRKFTQFGFSFTKRWWVDFAFGLGLGAGLMGLIFLIGWLTGSLRVTGFYITGRQGTGFIPGLMKGLALFTLVGIYEELLFRGYYLVNLAEGINYRGLGKRTAVWWAYGLSSLTFGLLHLGNLNATWVGAINTALAGVFLGLGMLLTGSLAIPIGTHIAWNFFQGYVFGFAVSGFQADTTLIGTEILGNTWLMGGRFGPESGALSLVAMLIGSLLMVLWVRRNGQLEVHADLAEYTPRPEPNRA